MDVIKELSIINIILLITVSLGFIIALITFIEIYEIMFLSIKTFIMALLLIFLMILCIVHNTFLIREWYEDIKYFRRR